MHIDRLEVKGFGKLAGRTIHLEKGINLIYGSNEAGKSTLQWFIKGMLYGLKGANRSRTAWMQPLKRFSPWSGGQYGGAMVYGLDDGRSFRVERDFDKDTVSLFDSSFNDITDQFDRGRSKQPSFAEAQLGLDETAFERTVLIRQLEVRLDEESSAMLAGMLANMGSSGMDDISFISAEKALADALKNNIGTGRTTTMPLDKQEARLAELDAKHRTLLEQQGQRNLLQNELLKIREVRSRLQAEKSYLEQIGELIGIRKALDRDMKQEAGLKEAVRQLKEIEAADTVTGSSVDTSRRSRVFPAPLLYIAAVVLFIVLFFYFAAAWTRDSNWILLLLCGGGVLSAGIAALLSFRNERKVRNAEGRAQPVSGKEVSGTYSVKDGISQRTALIKSICSSISILCEKQLDDAAAIRQEWKDVSARLEKLSRRLEAGIDAAGGTGSGIIGTFTADKLDMLLYDSTTDSLETIFKDEMDRIGNQFLDAVSSEKQLEGQLLKSQNDSDELQRVEEETVAVREKIEYLRHRGQALRLAHEVLIEAGHEVRRTISPGLDSRMSSIITGLTAGRYADLRGDDRLSLRVVVPENGDVRNVPALSGAAADQMYLALRLAMAGILTEGGESLPIIMDEIFSQFDDSRTELALKYLYKAYEKGQLLIFTCKQREVELAGKICGAAMNLVEL